MDDIQVDLFSEAVCDIIFDGFGHGAFGLVHGAGFGEGVQFFALDLCKFIGQLSCTKYFSSVLFNVSAVWASKFPSSSACGDI